MNHNNWLYKIYINNNITHVRDYITVYQKIHIKVKEYLNCFRVLSNWKFETIQIKEWADAVCIGTCPYVSAAAFLKVFQGFPFVWWDS